MLEPHLPKTLHHLPPRPLTLCDKSLNEPTLEQTKILNRETGLRSGAVLKTNYVSVSKQDFDLK